MTAAIKAIFLIWLISCAMLALSQKNSLVERQNLATQIEAAATRYPMRHQPGSTAPPALQIPESLLSQPRALKQVINQHFPAANVPLSINTAEHHTGNTCLDTSVIPNRAFNFSEKPLS